jgi:hypothetical protein
MTELYANTAINVLAALIIVWLLCLYFDKEL